eukprot:TRINITY_DN14797_c0_g1_i1.p1 TRINITY_DN14797_c0_g1~~TRINITY_DN14797_c0_g1_i1.p1  ORF type:complete len:282 (-),score=26.74 TRINITY_DN14797_c0_g1_i1:12-785(-)
MSGSVAWCFNGGYVNAVAMAGVWFTGLTHLTGTTTMSAVRTINAAKPGQYSNWNLCGFLLAWALGAMVSGAVVGPARLRWGRLQGVLTLIHGLSLLGGWYFSPVPDENDMGIIGGMMVSFAMGIQNSVTSLFSPFTLRTSHHSGTLLDIGIALGQCIHLRNWDNIWKVKVMTPNYLGFWVGALVGTVAWNHLGAAALLIPAGTAIAGSMATFAVFTFHMNLDSRLVDYEEIADDGADRLYWVRRKYNGAGRLSGIQR